MRLDLLLPTFAVDVKTVWCELDETEWDKKAKARLIWWEGRDYWRQFALYRFGARQNGKSCDRVRMIAVTKQDPPDVDLFDFCKAARFDVELDEVKAWAPRYRDIKLGEVEPDRCEKCSCAYCRGTKVITEATVLD